MQKLLKVASIMSGALVFIMMCVTFTISFDVLRKVVVEVGVTTYTLSYLFPVIVDGAILIFSFSALRNSIVGESILADMVLVGIFTAGSIGMNILHAPENSVSRSIAAIAPLALFLSTERLIAMVKSEVKRSGLSITMAQMKQRIEEMKSTSKSEMDAMKRAMENEKATLQDELASISQQITLAGSQLTELETKRGVLKDEIDALRAEKRSQERQMTTQNDALELANETRQAQIDARREMLVDMVRQQTGLSYSKLGETLGVSVATVKRDVDELMTSGVLHRNGNGLEIVA